MRVEWFFDGDGNLVFLYRARRFDTTPPRYMTATELLSVACVARDSFGNAVHVTQQPSYVAALGGYRGWLSPTDVQNLGFVTLQFTPVLAADPALAPNWAPVQNVDVTIDNLSQKIDTIQTELESIGLPAAQLDFG